MTTISLEQYWEYSHGLECLFVPVSKHAAYKLYPNFDMAARVLQRQVKARTHKIGPVVWCGGVVKVRVSPTAAESFADMNTCRKRIWWYGYVTHVVSVIDTVPKRAVRRLEKKLTKIFGRCPSDLESDGNIGKDGRFYVCLDFGDETFA